MGIKQFKPVTPGTRFRASNTANWKKAIVTLDSEHRINFF